MNLACFDRRPRGICFVVACFALAASVATSAHAYSVRSVANAISDGTPSNLPTVVESSIPGERVTQSAFFSYSLDTDNNGSQDFYSVGLLDSWASTSLGLNRISTGGQLSFVSLPGIAHRAFLDGFALSEWSDRITILGGNLGDFVTVTFSGTTRYSIYLAGVADQDVFGANINQYIAIGGPFSTDEKTFTTADFVTNRLHGSYDWEFNLLARSGDVLGIFDSLSATINGSVFDRVADFEQKVFSIDAGHTSLLTNIDITDGYSLISESGELVAHDGGFGYRAVLDELANPSPVPEPSTWSLMLAGLGMIFLARRKFVTADFSRSNGG